MRRNLVLAALLTGATLVGGCGVIVSNVSADVADNLSGAILNQSDPELVREALEALKKGNLDEAAEKQERVAE